MNDKQIIEKLLQIISGYQTDGITKDMILHARVTNFGNDVCITKLITKGEIGKDTPFYTASTKTMIIQEYTNGFETLDANVLFSESS